MNCPFPSTTWLKNQHLTNVFYTFIFTVYYFHQNNIFEKEVWANLEILHRSKGSHREVLSAHRSPFSNRWPSQSIRLAFLLNPNRVVELPSGQAASPPSELPQIEEEHRQIQEEEVGMPDEEKGQGQLDGEGARDKLEVCYWWEKEAD